VFDEMCERKGHWPMAKHAGWRGDQLKDAHWHPSCHVKLNKSGPLVQTVIC
jgi:hypothetical protein